MRRMSEAVYLGIQVINACDRPLDVTAIESIADIPPTLYACKVDGRLNTRLEAKFLCGRFISLNDEIIHDEAIEVSNGK